MNGDHGMAKKRDPVQAYDWDDMILPQEKTTDPFQKQDSKDPMGSFFGPGFWDEEPSTPPKRKKKRTNLLPVVAVAVVAVLVVAGVLAMQLFSGKPRVDIDTPPAATVSASVQKPALPSPQATQPQPAATQPTVTQPVLTGELRYLGEKLNDSEQQVYYQLVQALSQYQTTVELLPMTEELDVGEVALQVSRDYPEYFWFAGGSSFSWYTDAQGVHYTLTFTYKFTPEEAREHAAYVEAAIQPVLDQLQGKTDYEKVKGVYEYLIDHTVYDLAYKGKTVYELFHDGRAVCEGYARATHLLLNRLGVETILVFGESSNSDGAAWEGHCWNIVKLDGAYYQLDTTWGDPVGDEQTITYDYFNLTDAEISRDHRADDPSLYPACNATKYNYYRYEGYYLESFDKDKLSAWIQEAQNGQNGVTFKCADENLYWQVRTWLFDNGGVRELCPDIGTFFYNYSDTLFTVAIST